ncbi:YraN family protein [candidate division KSB1 bacterium]|nr:MAG: YraN family protein [candidate division KSB1 bacterium]
MEAIIDKKIWQKGTYNLAGVDEAGRGPLAGPVVASAIILPRDFYDSRIDDSKKLSESKREELYNYLIKNCVCYGIGIIDEKEIDRLNILKASLKAMKIAIENLSEKPDKIIVDGKYKPDVKPRPYAIIDGDSHSISIASASIIAKVTRDRIMKEYHKKYPEYRFDKNKGYGTRYHIEKIKDIGISPVHRVTFCQKFLIGDERKGIGRYGEDIACNYLRKRGYKIIERNFRRSDGEIDIVAEFQGTLVFIEVKTNKKGGFGEPEFRVTQKKQKQIGKMANIYLQEMNLYNIDCRFDVLAIKLEKDGFVKINHIKDAFWV